jgi:glycosyltransferase involved in cell wall biosynthesis
MIGLFPLPGDSPSAGPENVLYNLVHNLSKNNDVYIDIISIRSDIQNHFVDSIYSNVQIHYFPRIKYVLRSIGDAIIVNKFTKTHKFDLIHSHSPPALSFVLNIKTPKVLTLHGMYHLEKKHANIINKIILTYNYYILKNRIIPKLDGFVAISPYVIDEFKKMGLYDKIERVFQINNPIDESFYNIPINYENNIIFYPATITKRKNQLAALNVIELIKDDVENLKIVFTGGSDNNYYGIFDEAINDKKLNNIVEYRGKVSRQEILDLYHKASIVYLLSKQETQPMTVLEAMAAGTPIITSNIGSNEFLVIDGKTGYLVDPDDSRKIAECTIELLRNKQKMTEFGLNAKNIAKEQFHSSAIARKTLEMYTLIINND